MNLTQFRYLYGDVIKILLVVVTITIVGYFTYSYLTRDNPTYGKLPTQYFQNQLSGKENWSLTNLKVSKPNNAPIIKIKNRKFTRAQASALAVKLGLPSGGLITRDSEKMEHFSVNVNPKELSIDLTSGRVHFKESKTKNKIQEKPTIDEKTALDKALKYIKTLEIDTSLYDLENPTLNYFQATKSTNELIYVEKSRSNLVYVSFPLKLEGFDVVTVGGGQYLSLGIDNLYSLFSLEFSKIEVEPYDGTTYKLISDSEIKNDLNSGKGSLDHYTSGSNNFQNPDTIYVGQGKLTLYNDTKTEYLQPIFVFDSSVANFSDSLKADIYLPAVSSKYLKY